MSKNKRPATGEKTTSPRGQKIEKTPQMQFIDKVAGVPDSAVPKDSIVDSVQDIPVVQQEQVLTDSEPR